MCYFNILIAVSSSTGQSSQRSVQLRLPAAFMVKASASMSRMLNLGSPVLYWACHQIDIEGVVFFPPFFPPRILHQTYLILLVDLHDASGDPTQPASSAIDEDFGSVPTEEAKHPYLFTGETRSKLTRDKVAPDYAAVLTVCSRYLFITPIQLHAEVAQLEYEMAEVEASASSN